MKQAMARSRQMGIVTQRGWLAQLFRQFPAVRPFNMHIFSAIFRCGVLLVSLSSPMLQAEEVAGPDVVIRNTVERMIARIDAERDKLTEDDTLARRIVDEEITPIVDFRRIARAVMAEHFSSASTEQKHRFLNTFRNSLLETYASGITLYEGQQWDILPLTEDDVRGNRARVRMEVVTEGGEMIPIVYMLFQDRSGWRIDNVIVNGLNLGRVFRTQFAQAMQQYAGDVDQVIANWRGDIPEEAVRGGGDEA